MKFLRQHKSTLSASKQIENIDAQRSARVSSPRPKSFMSSATAFAAKMAKLKIDAGRLATSDLRREGFFSIESDGSSETLIDRPEGTSAKLGAGRQQDRNPQVKTTVTSKNIAQGGGILKSPRPARAAPTTFDGILATMDALTRSESSQRSGKSTPMRIITRTQKEVRLEDTAVDIVTGDPYEPSMTPAKDWRASVLLKIG
ncbi:hypothetical protein DL769_009870 [Monosporascus sp. CRB-8-3]|nr:hypothetical protein DL769_009870 [Monosporascus sp. CRB-8-3]